MNKSRLKALLKTTTGPSKSLDLALSKELNAPLADYTSSVDACLQLIHQSLPAAHWHIGRAEDGVSVYATLSNGGGGVERTNITVPLALLSALLAFLEGAATKSSRKPPL